MASQLNAFQLALMLFLNQLENLLVSFHLYIKISNFPSAKVHIIFEIAASRNYKKMK